MRSTLMLMLAIAFVACGQASAGSISLEGKWRIETVKESRPALLLSTP
jgi:hypothetical protein